MFEMFERFAWCLLEVFDNKNIQHWLLAMIGFLIIALITLRLNWHALSTKNPAVSRVCAWMSLVLSGLAIGAVLSTSYAAMVSYSSNDPDFRWFAELVGAAGMLLTPFLLFAVLCDITPFQVRRIRAHHNSLIARYGRR